MGPEGLVVVFGDNVYPHLTKVSAAVAKAWIKGRPEDVRDQFYIQDAADDEWELQGDEWVKI